MNLTQHNLVLFSLIFWNIEFLKKDTGRRASFIFKIDVSAGEIFLRGLALAMQSLFHRKATCTFKDGWAVLTTGNTECQPNGLTFLLSEVLLLISVGNGGLLLYFPHGDLSVARVP